jgi:hypothetical protein
MWNPARNTCLHLFWEIPQRFIKWLGNWDLILSIRSGLALFPLSDVDLYTHPLCESFLFNILVTFRMQALSKEMNFLSLSLWLQKWHSLFWSGGDKLPLQMGECPELQLSLLAWLTFARILVIHMYYAVHIALILCLAYMRVRNPPAQNCGG